jgi:hypothetical protein
MPALMLILLLAGAVAAQPADGDLVLATSTGTGFGLTACLDPARPGTFTTLTGIDPADRHTWVRMAPNNLDLVIARGSDHSTWPGRGDLVNVPPLGTPTTIAAFPTSRPEGFELGHDGRWVVVANKPEKTPYPPIPALCDLQGVRQIGGTGLQRIVYMQYNYDDVLIDRDPGPWQAFPYVVVTESAYGGVFRVLGPDRLSTLTGGLFEPAYAIELLPRSGHYLIAGGTSVFEIPKSGGARTTLPGINSGTAVKVTQTNDAWIAAGRVTLLRYDLSRKAVTATIPVSLPNGGHVESLELYGSRRLVCYQPEETPGVVTVTLRSRRSGDGNRSYALACSLGRRPGPQFPNGEWLDLDVTDPLFWTSATGQVPAIFQHFRGTTDASGNATATVNIPAGLPTNLGIAVFVAGVIYDQTGVRTVTNTHWFVL